MSAGWTQRHWSSWNSDMSGKEEELFNFLALIAAVAWCDFALTALKQMAIVRTTFSEETCILSPDEI